jgi:HprK-related kinase A
MQTARTTISELSEPEVLSALRTRGLAMEIGPVTVRLRTSIASLAQQMRLLYADYAAVPADAFADFDFHLERSRGLRRLHAPQAHLVTDGREQFAPFPEDHALPLFEWGFNWHFARRLQAFLLLHSASLASGDRGLLLPAWPGSGKSTLAAALASRGWRLLSDEFGLVDPADHLLHPFPRPVALKNESIEVMRRFAPDTVIGPVFPRTRKGDVAHLRPPAASVRAGRRPAEPAWIVFPRFERGAETRWLPIDKPAAFLKLAGNSFNYEVLGATGFEEVSRLIHGCDCRILWFGDLDSAIAAIEAMVQGVA